MNRLSQRLASLCEALGAATLIAMTVMVIVDIFMRSVLNQSLGFAEEVTGYLVVVVTFLGVALTFRDGVLFRVSFLYDKFPHALQRALAMIYLAATMAFCVAMTWFTALMVWSSFTRGKVAATELQTPIYLPQMVLPVGFLILLVFAAHQFIQGGAIPKDSEAHINETSGD